LQDVVACRPDKVVIWVGSNDVLARVSSKAKRFYQLTKHLPVEPTLEWFRVNIEAIACRLQNEASSTAAFCSLPPIGEDPDSTDPFQSEVNQLLEKYSAIIKDVTLRPRRALTSFRFLSLYRDALRTLILRRSPDEVARMNGWLFHTDGVHLNSRGGMIAADLIQEFIDR
jgi:lysophospholipase L1-like esterase